MWSNISFHSVLCSWPPDKCPALTLFELNSFSQTTPEGNANADVPDWKQNKTDTWMTFDLYIGLLHKQLLETVSQVTVSVCHLVLCREVIFREPLPKMTLRREREWTKWLWTRKPKQWAKLRCKNLHSSRAQGNYRPLKFPWACHYKQNLSHEYHTMSC